MIRYFNVTGACNPKFHYMVNVDQQLQKIKLMIDKGNYFTINRARQYGKTTMLGALERYLREEYIVVRLDFQMLGHEDFSNEAMFVAAFVTALLKKIAEDQRIPQDIVKSLNKLIDVHSVNTRLSKLFHCLSDMCRVASHPVVMMIDEVDSASNNQVFLDFLAQLRGYYISRTLEDTPIFQSVILAGVYDVKHLKGKINRAGDSNGIQQEDTDKSVRNNSPWNIATDFLVDMSFDTNGIAGMLEDYEVDHHTGMNVEEMAGLIYDYTSGYPYLVSRICNIIDERLAGNKNDLGEISAWNKSGFLEAVRVIISEKNSLFESLINKLTDYPELNKLLSGLLFDGREISYTIGSEAIENAEMFGFVKKENGNVIIANRIFETILYNFFLATPEAQVSDIYKSALQDKNQFIEAGRLNMRLVLEKFVLQFSDLYGEHPQRFYEEEGRKYFLMFLRPIINGVGNYYVEAQTRTATRSDVIVDYRGEQFVVELKIWKGLSYHTKGEEQLAGYLDFHRLKTGYMLTFNFNKKKETGIKEVVYGDKLLIEAVV